MSVTVNDLVIMEISTEMEEVAKYIAEKRILFEYPRAGYGDYDTRGLSKIKTGILGELGFLEYIFLHLEKKYGDVKARDRWQILHKKVEFAYDITIGKFDEGFEFKLGGKTIDIKTYDKEVTVKQIFNGLNENSRPLNLFIDKTQNTKADYYVQVFILQGNRICISGYYEGLPPLATWMPNPAYTCAVPDLLSINLLLEKI